jgi:hypothetical protein
VVRGEANSGAVAKKSFSGEEMYNDAIPEVMHGKYGGERVVWSESDKEMTISLALEMADRTSSIAAHLQGM